MSYSCLLAFLSASHAATHRVWGYSSYTTKPHGRQFMKICVCVIIFSYAGPVFRKNRSELEKKTHKIGKDKLKTVYVLKGVMFIKYYV